MGQVIDGMTVGDRHPSDKMSKARQGEAEEPACLPYLEKTVASRVE